MSASIDCPWPFSDAGVRKSWLDVLEYLEDDELESLTYRSWLQVAKDTAFDVLVEEGIDSEYAQEYVLWVARLRAEEMFLNRRDRARGRQV